MSQAKLGGRFAGVWDFIQANWLRPAICIGLFVAFGGVLYGSESPALQRHFQVNTASKI